MKIVGLIMNIFTRREVFGIMKNLLSNQHFGHNRGLAAGLIAAVVIFCILSGPVWPVENRSVTSPIGPATVPPSSLRSGLTRSPNPIDSSGNLVITGNVTGGRQFRGTVPYGSTTGFRAPLGSSSLDSFLRDSTSADEFDRYLERYRIQPYYSPTESVTTMTPGRSSVFTPSSTRIVDRAPDTVAVEEMPKRMVSPGEAAVPSDTTLRSMLPTQQQIDKLLSERTARYPPSQGLTTERYDAQMEELRQELARIKERAGKMQQRFGQEDSSLTTPAQTGPAEILGPQLEQPGAVETPLTTPKPVPPTAPPTPIERTTTLEPPSLVPTQELSGQTPGTTKGRLWTPEMYERVKQQIGNFQAVQKEETSEAAKAADQLAAIPPVGKTATGEGQADKEKPAFEIYRKGKKVGPESNLSRLPAAVGEEETQVNKTSVLEAVGKLSKEEVAAEAKRIMGPHKTLESFSQAKFDQFIKTAEAQLKQGKYYRAAEAFAQASIYKRDDPIAEAGRGHALFAAGEYMSSALCIARAIENSAEYAQTKIDIVAVVGDKDMVESRIAEIHQWLARTDTPELKFLLGYAYYRLGRLDRAKMAIDLAYEKMPQSLAVQTLKKAIEDATASSKPAGGAPRTK